MAKHKKLKADKATGGQVLGVEPSPSTGAKETVVDPECPIVAEDGAQGQPVAELRQYLLGMGKSEEQQTYDNAPVGILKAFPRKDQEAVRLDQLQEQLWWWLKANEEKAHTIFHSNGAPEWTGILLSIYQDYFEWSAYQYELRARYNGRYRWDFGHPWVHCSLEQRRVLDCLWPNPSPALNWLPSQNGVPGWIDMPLLKLNLGLNNSVLVEQFMSEVARLRKKHKIQEPKPGQGIRRKPISWKPVELADMRQYNLRPLTDGERSQLSKAFKNYEHACANAGVVP